MTKYTLRCTVCGRDWAVDKQTYFAPPPEGYRCRCCVCCAARPEWRDLSLDELHAIRRGIETELRALDANTARHAALFAGWLELDGLISAKGGAE